MTRTAKIVTRTARVWLVLVGCAVMLSCVAAPANAQFGIESGSLSTSFENADGVSIVPQASSHPYQFSISFKMNVNKEGHTEGGQILDVLVDLPKGMSGDPFAVPRCTRQDFEGVFPNRHLWSYLFLVGLERIYFNLDGSSEQK